jgi:hypothetical protein
MDDFESLFQRHSGKFILGGGSTVLSVVVSALAWFAGEYSTTADMAAITEQKLEAHTAMERENYQSLMEVLDQLQITTGEIKTDLAVVKYRLNAPSTTRQVNAQAAHDE